MDKKPGKTTELMNLMVKIKICLLISYCLILPRLGLWDLALDACADTFHFVKNVTDNQKNIELKKY